MTRPTRATRELACLALGHDDSDAVACPETDDDLMRHLVEEVQRLRVAAGIVEETLVDRQEQEGAVADALLSTANAEGWSESEDVLGHLTSNGWRLIRSRV